MGAVLDLINVLFEPSAVYERLREKPKVLAPYIALAVVAAILAVIQSPFTKAGIAAQMAQTPNITPEQAATGVKIGSTIALIAPPIFYIIILLLQAFLLWVTVSLLAGEAKFGTLLSVCTYASITFILLNIVGVIVLFVKGVGSIASPADLQPALGLDLLAPGATGHMLALLKGINPFAVWGVILTAIGVQVTHKTSKGTAYTAAIVPAVILLLIAAAFARS